MIKLSEPFFFGKEIKNLEKCIKSKWISSKGKMVKDFENKVKKITNSKYALGVINCTSALKLSIKILKPEDKDEILVPSTTYVSTVNAIVDNNCKPIFIDCDDKLLIDLEKVVRFIKENTIFKKGFSYNKRTNKKILAIVVVHTFGNLVNLNKNFIRFCKDKNIFIIEDAAESLGSYLLNNKKKIHAGTIGDIGCLSFNGNKIVTSGGGGMLLMKKNFFFKYAKYLASQAVDDPINFIHNEAGYNFGLSNLHAAIGISQLDNLTKVIKKKSKIHNFYMNEIKKIKGLRILKNPDYCFSNNWLNILEVDNKKYGLTKKKIIEYFNKFNIETRSLWYPNHLQKHCKSYEKYKVKKANLKFNSCLCLPSSYSLKKKDQSKIINLLKDKFKHN